MSRRENLKKLDDSYRDDRHINCVRFSSGESIEHKLAKCVAGILASEGVPVENIADYFNCHSLHPIDRNIETWKEQFQTIDNQDFIQEARFKPIDKLTRRADHWQLALEKILEFETDEKITKEGAITVRLKIIKE